METDTTCQPDQNPPDDDSDIKDMSQEECGGEDEEERGMELNEGVEMSDKCVQEKTNEHMNQTENVGIQLSQCQEEAPCEDDMDTTEKAKVEDKEQEPDQADHSTGDVECDVNPELEKKPDQAVGDVECGVNPELEMKPDQAECNTGDSECGMNPELEKKPDQAECSTGDLERGVNPELEKKPDQAECSTGDLECGMKREPERKPDQGESSMENVEPELNPSTSDSQEEVKKKNKSKKGKKEKFEEFPKSLEGFGYHFNEEEKLRNMETGEPFVFEARKGDRDYNQARYEALGEAVTEEVYKMLEKKLSKQELPVDTKKKEPKEPKSFFFMSSDALDNPEKLLILIHGSGVVRAGQWSRSLIINHSLESGTQLPYIERAMEDDGYAVMVLNTNNNYVFEGGRNRPIRGNSSPQEHAQYVWKHFVTKCKAKRIDIVAHSFGGVVTVDLVRHNFAAFKKRVHRIAFTDSVHSLHCFGMKPEMKTWMIEHARNWVTSTDALDTPQESFFSSNEIKMVSAGTTKHIETSWCSIDSVFKYLHED